MQNKKERMSMWTADETNGCFNNEGTHYFTAFSFFLIKKFTNLFLARFHPALSVYYNQFINLTTLTSEFTSSLTRFEPEAPVFQAYISLMS